jgi:hypothetical protein
MNAQACASLSAQPFALTLTESHAIHVRGDEADAASGLESASRV